MPIEPRRLEQKILSLRPDRTRKPTPLPREPLPPEEVARLIREGRAAIGKHRGMRLEQLPATWLVWACGVPSVVKLQPDLLVELARRLGDPALRRRLVAVLVSFDDIDSVIAAMAANDAERFV